MAKTHLFNEFEFDCVFFFVTSHETFPLHCDIMYVSQKGIREFLGVTLLCKHHRKTQRGNCSEAFILIFPLNCC